MPVVHVTAFLNYVGYQRITEKIITETLHILLLNLYLILMKVNYGYFDST